MLSTQVFPSLPQGTYLSPSTTQANRVQSVAMDYRLLQQVHLFGRELKRNTVELLRWCSSRSSHSSQVCCTSTRIRVLYCCTVDCWTWSREGVFRMLYPLKLHFNFADSSCTFPRFLSPHVFVPKKYVPFHPQSMLFSFPEKWLLLHLRLFHVFVRVQIGQTTNDHSPYPGCNR